MFLKSRSYEESAETRSTPCRTKLFIPWPGLNSTREVHVNVGVFRACGKR